MRAGLSIALLCLAGAADAEPEMTIRPTRTTYSVALPTGVDGAAAALAGTARLRPVVAGGETVGLRLAEVQADSLLARAGLQDGDILRAIDGRSVPDVAQVERALREAAADGRLRLRVDRSGHSLTLVYTHAGRKAAPAPPTSMWIRSTGPTTWRLHRASLMTFLADPAGALRSARLVPARRDGRPLGFKIFGIRPVSVPAALGLKNGDLVRAVNGLPLSTPAEALEAYGQLQAAEAITLEITRRGVPMTLTYTLDDALALPEAGP